MIRGIHFFHPDADHQFRGDSNQILKWITQVQLSPITLARSAYSEQVMLQEAALGVKQMIVLGAGMDTFAFRHPELGDELDIFEVDLPSEQQLKKERLRQAELVIPRNLHFVPMDFTREMIRTDSWSSLFRDVRTMFTLLGVSYYLPKEDLCRLIHHAFAPLPAGSSIVFDYADEHLFQEKGKYNRVENMVKMATMGANRCYPASRMKTWSICWKKQVFSSMSIYPLKKYRSGISVNEQMTCLLLRRFILFMR